MNITIVVPYVGNFGQKGFYNSQEIGLSKVLANHGNTVTVVRLHNKKVSSEINITEISNKINLMSIPSNKFGTHGLFNMDYLDHLNSDIMIIFSDIQMIVPKIHRWAKKRNIRVIDYTGVVHSNSHKKYIRLLSNIITARNIICYRKSIVFAKTPEVFNELKQRGVNDINLLHVGLDLDLMKIDFNTTDKKSLRNEFELDENDIVIAFIGRLENDKKPLELIALFKYLLSRDNRFRLLIVGSGKLKTEMLDLIKAFNLTNYIKHIEKLPNDEIWKIYHCSNLFLNLCQNEIFGMCILESMYYECPVLAVSAPGPNFIIENYKDGLILDSSLNEEQCFISINRILDDSSRIITNAKQKVMNEFVWENSALSLLSKIKYLKEKGIKS